MSITPDTIHRLLDQAIDELDDQLAKASKWKNLWFAKDGKSGLGSREYGTQVEAHTSAIEASKELLDRLKYFTLTNGLIISAIPQFIDYVTRQPVKASIYSHVIQVPIAGE